VKIVDRTHGRHDPEGIGITREDLATKSPQEQAAIMQKVSQILKQKMEEATAKLNGGTPAL
jgi:hypothetical protein